MNARQFYELVVNMRHAQREYFRTKNTKWLQDAKILESRVDAEIERVTAILNPKEEWKEGDIF